MLITLLDVQSPHTLFHLFHSFHGPVSYRGIDLRHNWDMERLLCSIPNSDRGIPQLELYVKEPEDVSLLLRYMQDGLRK